MLNPDFLPKEVIDNKCAVKWLEKSCRDDLVMVDFFRTKIKYFVSWSAGPFYFWDKSACGSNLIIEDNGKLYKQAVHFEVLELR